MIIEFSVANFLSFKDRVTFSMIASSSNGLDNNYTVLNDKRILKTASIYGANASGKTNLFKILNNIISMIKNSNNRDINDKLSIIPFKFDNEYINKPSEFEIKFIVDNIRYVYGFVADKNQIYEEYLYYYPNGRETKIFDRVNTNEYTCSQKDERILKDIERKNTMNKFFLATATNWNFAKTKPAYDFLTSKIGTFFNIEELKNMALNIYEKDDPELRKFTLDFLKKTDFNIEDYKITKVDIPAEFLNSIPEIFRKDLKETPKTIHVLFKHIGSDNYLSMNEESLGTQLVFALIPFIADTLNNQKILLIDELDKSLHPYLVQYIVEMFNNPDINKSNAQLIFNTHDTNLLDLNVLRRDQIWFTEKNNDNGVSDLYVLSDFSVRNKENVEKGYLIGRYGAVPFIKNDLNLWEEE